MSTWYNVKLRTLQKMFSANGRTIPQDSSTADYIAAMPGAVNEALQLLTTSGKFITKYIKIAHNPQKNLLNDMPIQKMERGVMTFSASGCRSIYFEYFGVITYVIKVGDTQVATDTLASRDKFAEFKALVSNAQDSDVTLEIHSDYPVAVNNIAMYSASFESADDIQAYKQQIRYNLKDLAEDFYMLSDEPVVFEGDYTSTKYANINSFFQEGDTVLVLPRDICGDFTILYKAYPPIITEATPDDYELPLDPEVDALLPLYMASQIYKDDDVGIATGYRNEFEVGREALRNSTVARTSEHFTSESGWI